MATSQREKVAAAYLLRLLGAIKKTRAPSRWLVRMYLCLCQFGDKKLTTSNTFVHHAESVDECDLCFSEEVERDILSSSFDRFHDAVASFACTESVSGSSSSLQSSFFTIFFASCGLLFVSGCSLLRPIVVLVLGSLLEAPCDWTFESRINYVDNTSRDFLASCSQILW